MKPQRIDEYHVFLASPGDTIKERGIVREFFKEYNNYTASSRNLRFTVVDWENYSTIGVGRPQELITKQTLEKFKDSLALVIGIMAQKFGSPTGTHESGTEEEFDWALTSHINTGFPEIKWFFRDINTFQAPSDPGEIERALEQWKRVCDFRKRIEASEPPIFYKTFVDTIDFKEIIRKDLTSWLNDQNRPWNKGRMIESPTGTSVKKLPENYYQKAISKFQSLDIAGIDNDRAIDIPLGKVYVRLRVIKDQDEISEDQQIEEGMIDIHSALGNYKRIVIVGDPGSGKSTFLKFIALMLARAEIENNPTIAIESLNLNQPLPIPFFISLWDLSDYIKGKGHADDHSILNFIIEQLSEIEIQITPNALKNLLEEGKCCLLFDGLDEVPTEQGRAKISRLVENFVKDYNKNRFVVTCRVRGYTGDSILKAEFVRCDIQDFNEEERREFITNWFAALFGVSRKEVLDERNQFYSNYQSLCNAIEKKDRIRELAVNPLLLTVIAIVHWNRKRLPDQRVDLYDECTVVDLFI